MPRQNKMPKMADFTSIDGSGGFNDLDLGPLVDLRIEQIAQSADEEAKNFTDILLKLYCEPEFINDNPALLHQAELYSDNLRLLYQMKNWDDAAAKALMNGIQQAPTNASLYRALSEMQRTVIAITEKIDDTKQQLISLIKNYKLSVSELITENGDNTVPENSINISRGSKEYIKKLQDIHV